MTASWPTASATSGSQVDQTPSTTTNHEVIRWPSAGPTGKTEYGAPLPPRRPDDRRQPVGGEEGAGDPVQVLRRQRPRSADDRTAGGREDAAGQAGLRADEADQLVQAAALGDRLQQLALAVQGGGELRPAPGGDAADDELGEGREGHVLGHRQQRQVVAAAGLDHVRWHAVEHRLAGGEGHRSGGGAGRDEPLASPRGCGARPGR